MIIDNVVLPSAGQWKAVIHAMRNPLNSWDKSDSSIYIEDGIEKIFIGEKDWDLMKRLYAAGRSDRKYLRMLNITFDITAPRMMYHELDTYKIGTVSNSCSTMHTIHKKPFTRDDFVYTESDPNEEDDELHEMCFENVINELNRLREKYIFTKDKIYWRQLIEILPQSYLQRRTMVINYETLNNIYQQRKNHKLKEWHIFCDWLKTLPYSELITGEFKNA